MTLPIWSAAPFALLLLCIALLPLVSGHWWHSNRNKAIVSTLFSLPVIAYLITIGPRTNGESTHQLIHELKEYASFIILLTALYAISGGILISGDIPARPRTNLLVLAIGAVLANFIGTTGASMVLIRPILRINSHRRHKAHLPIFFIFVVSNTGGLLTPLGDPPLFLGFLGGVDFFWTLQLWRHWLLVNGLLLAIFYIWDLLAYQKETATDIRRDEEHVHPLRISGLLINLPLLIGVITTVLFESPAVGQALGLKNFTLEQPWGEVIMIVLTIISLALTPKTIRTHNRFIWGPMIEVAVLFIGIFITMVPALALLREHGNELNVTRPWQYFWLTGLLSSFLDNAPTYLTFATVAAQGNPLSWLQQHQPEILRAISCGAVFMGALTYIGNGPNFMVKALAEEAGYPMPSFFRYMLYSAGILLPLFVIVMLAFMP
jgi:Na+/H+ antiporter NhaD/arsenite permease-like protein